MSASAWVSAAIRDFAKNVGSIVPNVFESYARIFHPLEGGLDLTWSDLAARNGRIAHAEMQHHLIAHPPGRTPTRYEPLDAMRVGSLPRPELASLVTVLTIETPAEADCWFAVWEGFGQLHGGAASSWLTRDGRATAVPAIVPAGVLAGPRLELPGRSYLLLRGALADVVDVVDLLGDQSPNLWWPDDRSWLVATEIDFGWTYLGGRCPLIDSVIDSPALEAFRARIGDGVTFDSDHLNAALDAT